MTYFSSHLYSHTSLPGLPPYVETLETAFLFFELSLNEKCFLKEFNAVPLSSFEDQLNLKKNDKTTLRVKVEGFLRSKNRASLIQLEDSLLYSLLSKNQPQPQLQLQLSIPQDIYYLFLLQVYQRVRFFNKLVIEEGMNSTVTVTYELNPIFRRWVISLSPSSLSTRTF